MSGPTRSASRGTPLRKRVARLKRRARLALRRRVAPGYGLWANHELVNVGIPADVVAYFADPPTKLYQLDQWLPILERVHERRPVVIVCRDLRTVRELRHRTSVPMIFIRRYANLVDLYERSDYQLALYVNNAAQNFQSLAAAHMVHVHVNHGESDKSCMVSNQLKAYDRIFVAGDAAVARHVGALYGFDLERLVKIGRPQLDVALAASLPPSPRRTLLYAPTWVGEVETNNYTSVDRYGAAIVRAMLAVPDVRVVYHPHPRIPTANSAVGQIHRQIVELIEAATLRDPQAGHQYSVGGPILSLFPNSDLMITDISSVGLDFLYLRTDAPLFITDRFDDRDRLLATAPVAAGADVIDTASLPRLTETLERRLAADALSTARRDIRRYYFGDLEPGESTRRFLDQIDQLIAERAALRGTRPPADSTDWAGASGGVDAGLSDRLGPATGRDRASRPRPRDRRRPPGEHARVAARRDRGRSALGRDRRTADRGRHPGRAALPDLRQR